MSVPRRSAILLGIFAVALVVGRIIVAASQRDEFFASGDQSYDDLAVSIRAGDGFSPNGVPFVGNPPVYPLLVAATYTVGGRDWWSVSVLQILIDLGSMVLVYLLARRLFDERVALTAAGIYAVYPYLAGQSALLMDTSLFTFLLLAFLVLLIRVVDRRTALDALACGGVAALALLVRPSGLVIIAVTPLLVVILGMRPREGLKLAAAAVLAGVVVLAPWTVRNAVQFDGFEPFAAKGGVNFWKGNSPQAAEFISAGISVDLLPEQPGAPVPPSDLSPLEEDDWWYDQAFEWIRDNPGDAAYGVVVKGEAFWTPVLNPATGGNQGLKDALFAVSYGPMLLFALASLAFLRDPARRRQLLFLLTVIAAFFLVHLATVAYTRLRAPIDPLLIILAATSLVTAAQWLRPRVVSEREPR